MSVVLLEDSLKAAIDARLAAIKATPALLQDVFPAGSTALTEMTAWFTEQPVPEVRYGWPRRAPASPMFVMVLRGDPEIERAIGDVVGYDTGTPFEYPEGKLNRVTIDVFAVAPSTVLVRWLHVILEDAVLRAQLSLMTDANGWVHGIELDSGDLSPSEDLVPDVEFTRYLRVQGTHPVAFTRSSSQPIADITVVATGGV